MTKLTNKTLFVSGASRGIGLAIAKRAAADGANIILAAKTAEPHPKLPGAHRWVTRGCTAGLSEPSRGIRGRKKTLSYRIRE